MTANSIRRMIALGCLLIAVAIAGEAIAAHALPGRVDPSLVDRFDRAMRYLILHGLASIALANIVRTAAQRIAFAAIMLGALVFCATLALSVFWPAAGITRFAPFGGGAMILGWLALAGALVLQRR